MGGHEPASTPTAPPPASGAPGQRSAPRRPKQAVPGEPRSSRAGAVRPRASRCRALWVDHGQDHFRSDRLRAGAVLAGPRAARERRIRSCLARARGGIERVEVGVWRGRGSGRGTCAVVCRGRSRGAQGRRSSPVPRLRHSHRPACPGRRPPRRYGRPPAARRPLGRRHHPSYHRRTSRPASRRHRGRRPRCQRRPWSGLRCARPRRSPRPC